MKPVYRCRVCGSYTEEEMHCGQPAAMLLDPQRRLRLSKLMSALLRHIPEKAGLKLDPSGWVEVEELVRAIRERWAAREAYRWVSVEHVVAIARLDPKGRFQLDNEGRRIRATYGHSIKVNIGYERLEPPRAPRILYHGTPAANLPSILREGLKPMRRLYVHLSTSFEDAVEVGARKGDRIAVLRIDSRCLSSKGVPVYVGSPKVLLAPYVPPDCISVEGIVEERQKTS
ncbi:MAG: RNA 2'-phosphotransferase [Thermoproteota archaeon]